jgi:glyoxylate reductase
MKVLVTIKLPEEILSSIRLEHEVEINEEDRPFDRARLLQTIPGKDGLLCTITDGIDTELLKLAPALKVVANCGVGFEHIDVEVATRMGVLVTNTPGVLTDATADLAFALILSIARRVVEGDRMTRGGEFKFWAPFHFLGCEVTGKTLGIIGFGRIGKAVARRAAGFSMRIIYNSRNRLDRSVERELNVEFASPDQLLQEADFVSLHMPLTPETRHVIGARELKLMKPSAYLINTARGPVVDEAALVEALRNREIRGAGLDVYENEPQLASGLSALENVVLLPHLGSATIETRTRMAAMAAENLLAALKGRVPPNCLNCQSAG